MNKARWLFWSIAAFMLWPVLATASQPFDPQAEISVRRQIQADFAAQRADAARSLVRRAELANRIAARGAKAYNPIAIVSTLVEFSADTALGTIATTTTLVVAATEDSVNTAEFSVSVLDDFSIEDSEGNPVDYETSYYQTIVVALPEMLDEGDETTLVFRNNGNPNCVPDSYFGMTFCEVSEEIVFFASVDWMPSKAAYTYEDLYGTAGIDLIVTTPPNMVAVSTSDLDHVEQNADQWVHYFVGHFSSSFIGLAYADFDTFSTDTAVAQPVSALIHEGSTAFGQDWADIGADVVNYFAGVYSPYVYNKHDLIQAVEELGGGVGPQSASFYYASALTTDPAYTFSEGIFSHEIAHSWWGNMIRDGDSYSPWINEGFAEYSSRRYTYQVWPEYYGDYLYEIYFDYFLYYVDPSAEVPMSSDSIYSADSLTYQAVTYWKGAHFLRMLEWLLGEDEFLGAMSVYANQYTWENNQQLVDSGLFRDTLETETGVELHPFFATWTLQTGHPVYVWAAQFDETDSGYDVRVRVTQTQDTDKVYDIPVEVQVWAGEDSEPTLHRLEFDGAVAEATYSLSEAPRGVRVDGRSRIWGEKIPALVGDIDASNDVDGVDFIYAAWSQGGEFNSYDHWNYLSEADFNHDYVINETDMDLLLAHFGEKGVIE